MILRNQISSHFPYFERSREAREIQRALLSEAEVSRGAQKTKPGQSMWSPDLERSREAREPQVSREARNSLPAFTLFESTVAITIIAIVIGISTLIYSNVLEAERPVAYYQARQEIDKIFNETKLTQAFFSKNFSYETFEIDQKVDFYNGNKRLYKIDYVVQAQGKQWWTESHLVANRQDAR